MSIGRRGQTRDGGAADTTEGTSDLLPCCVLILVLLESGVGVVVHVIDRHCDVDGEGWE